MGCSQAVRHGTLTPAFPGSNPGAPANEYQSTPCCGNSSTPPAARRSSATGCSSKPSCTRRAPGLRGGTCPMSSATGTPSTTAFAAGKSASCGSDSGSGSRASVMNSSRSCSSTRRLCGRISTRPGRQKKRRTTGPGSGSLSGWTVHQAARGLHRRTHRRIVRAEWGRSSRLDGVRAGVGGGGGGAWGGGCGHGQGV